MLNNAFKTFQFKYNRFLNSQSQSMLRFHKSQPHVINNFHFLLPISKARVVSTYQQLYFFCVHLPRCNHPSVIIVTYSIVSQKLQVRLLHQPFHPNDHLQFIAAALLVSNSHHHFPQNLQVHCIRQSRLVQHQHLPISDLVHFICFLVLRKVYLFQVLILWLTDLAFLPTSSIFHFSFQVTFLP